MGVDRLPIEERVGNENREPNKIAIGTNPKDSQNNNKMTYADVVNRMTKHG